MADSNINVNIKGLIEQGGKTRDTLKKEGAFSGAKGTAAEQKINNLLETIRKIDPSNTKELVKQLRLLSREFLNSSKYAKNISEEAKKAVNQVALLEKKQAELETKRSEAIKKQKEALEKINKDSKYKYINKATGRELTKAKSIATAGKDNLTITNAKGEEINGAAKNTVWEKEGYKDLSNALAEVEQAKQNLNIFNEELAKAAATAEEFSKLNGQGQSVGSAVDFQNEINKLEGTVNKKETETIEGLDVDVSTKGLEKQEGTFKKVAKSISLYAIGMRLAKKALHETIKTVTDLDKYLTQQAMVTGKTRKETYGLLKSYQEMATQLGATTKQVAEVATEYMKQGKTAQDALTLTRAAVSAAKVAGISTSESVDYLTTALNGFQLSAEDAMKVSDKFAKVASQSASGYEELAIALSKVASQANLAGMSIDYTTALLTKGLETTREAPETMGTALKTIIARMRELGDYGETLDDSLNINNVESQLKYVDIELRNSQGELRSTQDVLDELGRKWDTLNKNQQAAIAKALAGTRQQSRLIAMMTDYERVIELQEMAEQSQGATMAQMSTYLEGMDAAMNKITTAWEKIVSSLTDSNVVIGLVEAVSNILNGVNSVVSNAYLLEPLLVGMLAITVSIVSKKIEEFAVNKKILGIQSSLEKQKRKIRLLQLKELIIEQEKLVAGKKSLLDAAIKAKDTKTAIKLEAELVTEQEKLNGFKNEQLQLSFEENTLLDGTQQKLAGSASMIALAGGGIASLVSGSQTWLIVLSLISAALRVMPALIKIATAEQDKQNKKTLGGALLQMGKNAAANLGIPGLIIAAALLTAAGIAAVAGISSAIGSAMKSDTDEVNQLSNEIYKLNQKADSIKNVANSYDELDKKLLKTNADIKEQVDLLNKASDSLDEEEKKIYDSLATNEKKREYLNQVLDKANQQLANKRQQQVSIIRGMSSSRRSQVLNGSDSNDLLVQDAILALNNNTLNELVDKYGSAAKEVRSFTQSILENMNAEDAWRLLNNELSYSVEDLLKSVMNTQIAVSIGGKTSTVAAGEVLGSDDYSIVEQVEAYKQMLNSLSGDKEALQSFTNLYNQYEVFSHMTEDTLKFIEASELTVDKLNELYKGYSRLNKAGIDISESEYQNRYYLMLDSLAGNGGDIASTIRQVFGDYLLAFDEGSEEWINAWNALVSNFGDLVEKGILNMGQNMTALKNTINNFYETSAKWAEMNDSEKSEFLQDNADLFSGKSGAELLRAFEAGNYERIQQALSNNEALKERVATQLEEVERELKIELAREGKDRNESYIQQLQEYKKFLTNQGELYSASLELKVENENKQLDEYKKYLEKQQKALQDSLDKRKEAYTKYFEAINKEESDEDYEEEAQTYISNLTKLAASTNGASKQTSLELQQKLEDLEKERIKELRQRAQEAITNQIENEVSEINKKFDKLLENNQALVNAMIGQSSDPSAFIASLLTSNLQGMSALEAQNYIRSDFAGAFSNMLPAGALDNVSVTGSGDNLILNINGKEIQINETTQQELFTTITAALRAQGLR